MPAVDVEKDVREQFEEDQRSTDHLVFSSGLSIRKFKFHQGKLKGSRKRSRKLKLPQLELELKLKLKLKLVRFDVETPRHLKIEFLQSLLFVQLAI